MYGAGVHIFAAADQVGHMSVGAFEREITRLVVDHEFNEELFKIMSGLFEGLPLFGEELIERWRRKAAYTEALQRTTIEKRWKFFPWWYFEGYRTPPPAENDIEFGNVP